MNNKKKFIVKFLYDLNKNIFILKNLIIYLNFSGKMLF